MLPSAFDMSLAKVKKKMFFFFFLGVRIMLTNGRQKINRTLHTPDILPQSA
jgi:hypothetical protein